MSKNFPSTSSLVIAFSILFGLTVCSSCGPNPDPPRERYHEVGPAELARSFRAGDYFRGKLVTVVLTERSYEYDGRRLIYRLDPEAPPAVVFEIDPSRPVPADMTTRPRVAAAGRCGGRESTGNRRGLGIFYLVTVSGCIVSKYPPE